MQEPSLFEPWNCEEDDHDWVFIKSDSEGNCLYRCRYCRIEEVN